MSEDYQKKLKSLLRRLFQFESSDLDFGIYRIMNYKRDEIDNFIEKDLIRAIETAFDKYIQSDAAILRKELKEIEEKIRKDLGQYAIDDNGNINDLYKQSNIAKEYEEKKKALEAQDISLQKKAEIFSHIYEFFSRYYDNGDFLSKRRYSQKTKYVIPYNGEEVLLHWTTKDQYYIKTDAHFRNYSFDAGSYKVKFLISDVEAEENNNKTGKRFFLLKKDESFTIDDTSKIFKIFFEYRELNDDESKIYGARNIQESILEETTERILKYLGDSPLKTTLTKVKKDKSLLETHIFKYTKRNTSNYFIHKNLKNFLQQELDFYLKNEVMDLDDLLSKSEKELKLTIAQNNAIKEISNKIIDFVAQIEDFQKALFLKKKFVLKTEYCMTLDKVPEDLYPEICSNEKQIEEWKGLYKIGEIEKNTLFEYIEKDNKITPDFLKRMPYLVIDTKHFDGTFKDKLIGSFSYLDEEIGGVVIKSENFQALNLLQEKYREKVKCIYIDPPYNTGKDDFIYKDNYKHSSWISMIQDRIGLSLNYLSKQGILMTSLDENEFSNLKLCFNYLNYVGTLIVQTATDNNPTQIKTEHEYILVFSQDANLEYWSEKSEAAQKILDKYEELKSIFDEDLDSIQRELRSWIKKNKDRLSNVSHYDNVDEKGVFHDSDVANTKFGGYVYDIVHPITGKICKIPEKGYRFPEDTMKRLIEDNEIVFGKDENVLVKPKKRIENVRDYLRSVIYEDGRVSTKKLENMFYRDVFPNPKSESILSRVIIFTTNEKDTILDYFAGSGTTAHAVLSLKRENKGDRKYLLVEMGKYFDTVLVPRIKKVIFSSKWKEGIPESSDGISHIFKYQYLEQYEDSLNNIEFSKDGQQTLLDLDGFFVRYLLDFETKHSPCRVNFEMFKDPFNYKLKIGGIPTNVDLIETFNYLLGIQIQKIKTYQNNSVPYKAVFATKEKSKIVIIWRKTEDLDLKLDKDFVESAILIDYNPNLVYINGDSYIDKAQPIEPEFKRLMGA